MNEFSKDYWIGVSFVSLIFIVGLILGMATEFMLLIIAYVGMRFVAISKNNVKGDKSE